MNPIRGFIGWIGYMLRCADKNNEKALLFIVIVVVAAFIYAFLSVLILGKL